MTITGFTPSTKADEMVQRFEVFTGSGRRREWSDEEKLQIVAESHSGEMSVSAVRGGTVCRLVSCSPGGGSRGKGRPPSTALTRSRTQKPGLQIGLILIHCGLDLEAPDDPSPV